MIELAKRRLGKNPAVFDERTLKFSKYLQAEIFPPIPPVQYWSHAISNWEMFLNDELGDCVPAELAHSVMAWTGNAGKLFTPTNADVLKVYKDVGGYVPGDPSTDQGCNILDMLKYARRVGIGGKKIKAFAALGTPEKDKPWLEAQQAIDLFGGVCLGVMLPISAQTQENEWQLPPEGLTGDGTPGSWGGHNVLGIDYIPQGIIVVTWGGLLLVSWNFLWGYCDEGYAVLSNDWMQKGGWSPSGFNMAQLDTDLSKY